MQRRRSVDSRYIVTPFFLDERDPALEFLGAGDWQVNTPELASGETQRRMTKIHEPIADFVRATLTGGKRPVSVAGDCCATLGVAAGLQRAGLNPTLLWLDAHGDFNTWGTSPSGFLGGMPLAMLVGRGDLTLAEALGLVPMPEERVWLFDGRDLDPLEGEALAASSVRRIEAIGDFTNEMPPLDGPLYVHLDVDVVDPTDVTAVGYPAPGGPSARALGDLLRWLADHGSISAISMTTWSPKLDVGGRSQRMCMELLRQLTG